MQDTIDTIMVWTQDNMSINDNYTTKEKFISFNRDPPTVPNVTVIGQSDLGDICVDYIVKRDSSLLCHKCYIATNWQQWTLSKLTNPPNL